MNTHESPFLKNILVGSELRYLVSSPTSLLLHMSVATTSCQRVVNEEFHLTPFYDLEFCQVGESGNRLQRFVAQPGDLTISYRAEATLDSIDDAPNHIGESMYRDLPAAVLPFLNPSRYCESDKLFRFAGAEFGHLQPGYSRVMAICHWTYAQLSYTPGSTGPTTTACDVLLQRTGVCRDYAHVAISLCRAMGIPARYVSGYAVALEPPDFHGYFEAFLEGRWYMFDATRLAPLDGFVRIGTGRDAADVAFATLIGDSALQDKQVWANEVQSSGGF